MITDRRVLSDRYEILDFIGEGGMARVYRGRDRVLERVVAIKVLSSDLATEPTALERFRREAQAAAGLNHPGVVAVYDTGADDGIHYIVMQHLEGQTLDRVLRDEERLNPERALEVTEQVCAALDAAHARGVIHRDVKPGNIMFGPNGSVKVMDFGIARAAESDTGAQTASILGTATYLSPEQARGDRVDARSDVYSLGVVLYEMLTGRPPFTADSAVAVAAKHVEEDPVPPSWIDPALGPRYDAMMMRALAKDPEERYASAREFAADLRSLRAGNVHALLAGTSEYIPSQPTEDLAPVPAHRPVRRRSAWPWVAAVIVALLVLALLVALTMAGLNTGQESELRPEARSPSPPAATTAPPATQPPPREEPPPAEEPISVEQAFAALVGEVTDGVQEGEISNKAANEITKTGRDVFRSWQRDEPDKALEELDELRGEVDELAEEGEITSDDRVAALHEGIDDLEAAIEAA